MIESSFAAALPILVPVPTGKTSCVPDNLAASDSGTIHRRLIQTGGLTHHVLLRTIGVGVMSTGYGLTRIRLRRLTGVGLCGLLALK
jgi:hypothetical protein